MELGSIAGKAQHIWKHHFPGHIATECLLQPAVQRPLEPTRISYSRTKIPATLCLPLDPEGMFWRLKPKHHLFHVNLMSAALLRIGHIEMKIWENLVCHLVFSFFQFWCHRSITSEEITIASTSRNTLYKFMSQDELPVAWRGKRISCEEDTSTHLFFVHLFAHDLRPHAQVYILICSRIWR